MKILLYGVNYAPELTGIGKYSGEMAEWLVKQGHDVRVVTALPYYPEWKVDAAYKNAYAKEVVDGVSVYRCPLYVPAKPSGLKRIIHLVSFALSSFPVMLRQVFWKPDVVMVIEPPLFCAPTAWFTARLSGAKCWLHVQDFEVDAAFELGIISFDGLKKIVLVVERWLMRRFDVVSSISQSMVKKLEEKGVKAPVFFPNWANLSSMQYDEVGGRAFRQDLNILEAQTLCLYSGNIAVKQGLDILLDVAVQVPETQFVICGEGANKAELETQAKEQRLPNIHFLPLQPLNKLPGMLSAADIHLVIQKAGAADLVLPSKLTNILAVGGVAIVTAEEGTELGQLASGDKPCVYRCEPESVAGLVSAIEGLNQQSNLHQNLSDEAKQYAQDHIGMNKVLEKWENTLKQLNL